MNKLITRRLKTVMVFLLIFSYASFAQFKNVDFLNSGPADAGKIVRAYVAPWANAFGASLNGGWYNTAKPHKFGGFDITGNISVAMVPTSAETFNLSSLGLSSNIVLPASSTTPTIAGSSSDNIVRPTISYKESTTGITLGSFKMPPGTSWRLIPAPILQVGVGLPLGSEVKVRYLPKVNIENGDISLWGVGLMHSIMQYIPGHKLIPVLDVSLFGGFNKLEGNVPLKLQPDNNVAPSNYTTTYLNNKPFDSQKLNITIQALTVSAVVSANLRIITFYGGIGYAKNSTVISIKGNFPKPTYVATPLPGRIEYNDASSFSGSSIKNLEIKDFSGLRANLGFRLKFGVFTMHADYTRAMYNVVSAGLGLSFR
jgi:hypothetical protein